MVSAALNFIFPAFTMEITGLVQFVGFSERNLKMFKTDIDDRFLEVRLCLN